MIDKEKVVGSLGSVLFVVLAFSGGWFYIDQQRLNNVEAEKNAYKIKVEGEAALLKAREIEERIRVQESKISTAVIEYSKDKELSELTLKFINEVSGVDFHNLCGDDPVHNEKARKAKALLQLIEAKAIEYGKTELLESFVRQQNFGIGGWSSKCKS